MNIIQLFKDNKSEHFFGQAANHRQLDFFEMVQAVFYSFGASKMIYEPIRMVSLKIKIHLCFIQSTFILTLIILLSSISWLSFNA